MDLFIVFEIINTGSQRGDLPRPRPAEPTFSAMTVGVYTAESASAACVMAARESRRLGNYAAIQATPMSIDFTAEAMAMTVIEPGAIEDAELGDA